MSRMRLGSRECRPSAVRKNMWLTDCLACCNLSILFRSPGGRVWEYCPDCRKGQLWYPCGVPVPTPLRKWLWDFWKDMQEFTRNVPVPGYLLEKLGLPSDTRDPIHTRLFSKHYALIPDYRRFRSMLGKKLHRNYEVHNVPPHEGPQTQTPVLIFPAGPVPGLLTGFQLVWTGGFGKFLFKNYLWTDFGCTNMHRSQLEHVFLEVVPEGEWVSFDSLLDLSDRWARQLLLGKKATLFCGLSEEVLCRIPPWNPAFFLEDPFNAELQPRYDKGGREVGSRKALPP